MTDEVQSWFNPTNGHTTKKRSNGRVYRFKFFPKI